MGKHHSLRVAVADADEPHLTLSAAGSASELGLLHAAASPLRTFLRSDASAARPTSGVDTLTLAGSAFGISRSGSPASSMRTVTA
ncbi:hypothetical protein D3C85_1723180 [compost metagenome]